MVGVKVAVSWKLAPGLSLIGKVRWLNEKAVPCLDEEVIRSTVLPVLESVKV